MTPDEREAYGQIARTYPTLDEWREVVASGFVPSAGSALAEDDEHWPYWSLTEMTNVGLAAAFDHLDAVRTTIEAHRVFPMAQTSLLRAGLIGAAQSVWLLESPDPEVRRTRHLTLVDYLYTEHGKYLRLLLGISPDHPGTIGVAEHVHLRGAEVRERRQLADDRSHFETTRMIEQAARAVFLPVYVDDIRAMWKASSGIAHGLPWPLLGHEGLSQDGPEDGHGRAVFTAAGDLGRIANQYACVFELARHGWGLRSMRSCEAPRVP